jgi:soluble lytic murein transglycosylase-like protein
MRAVFLVVLTAAGWAQTVPVSNQAQPAAGSQNNAVIAKEPGGPQSSAAPLPGTKAPGSPSASSAPVKAAIDPQLAMAAAQAAMAASIELQRTAVLKQVGALGGKAPPASGTFFTVPWMDNAAQFIAPIGAPVNVPPCDPLPNDKLDPLIEQNAQRESVRADLIRAVISEESGRRPCAISPKGAQGLMQLMPSVIEQFGVRDAFDPAQNVEAGTKLLKQLLAKYNGDLRLALSAYNAGPDRVDKEGGVPPIPETTNYVTDILSKLPNF